MTTALRSYGRWAWCYDELAAFYSLGAIPRAKAAVADALVPGERALFVGVGRGADALRAAERGVHVTALDASSGMLVRLRAGLDTRRLPAVCVLDDLFTWEPGTTYAEVVASYVLDLFAAEDVARAITRLTQYAQPGGRVWVADFAPPDGPLWRRAAARLHYWPVALAGRALGLCTLHPLCDYGATLTQAGLRIERVRDFGLHRVWCARKPRSS